MNYSGPDKILWNNCPTPPETVPITSTPVETIPIANLYAFYSIPLNILINVSGSKALFPVKFITALILFSRIYNLTCEL